MLHVKACLQYQIHDFRKFRIPVLRPELTYLTSANSILQVSNHDHKLQRLRHSPF
jgi:hypothetical protein